MPVATTSFALASNLTVSPTLTAPPAVQYTYVFPLATRMYLSLALPLLLSTVSNAINKPRATVPPVAFSAFPLASN